MLKNILNLEGVTLLTKEEQKRINGAEKCKTTSIKQEPYAGTDGTALIGPGYPMCTCTYQCRPSFLGIGFGSWGEEFTAACNC